MAVLTSLNGYNSAVNLSCGAEWGEALGTISYDLATGIGARVPRIYSGGSQ